MHIDSDIRITSFSARNKDSVEYSFSMSPTEDHVWTFTTTAPYTFSLDESGNIDSVSAQGGPRFAVGTEFMNATIVSITDSDGVPVIRIT